MERKTIEGKALGQCGSASKTSLQNRTSWLHLPHQDPVDQAAQHHLGQEPGSTHRLEHGRSNGGGVCWATKFAQVDLTYLRVPVVLCPAMQGILAAI